MITINHKLQVELRNIFLKFVSAISAILNSKILIVSGATIWVIFQNLVTCMYCIFTNLCSWFSKSPVSFIVLYFVSMQDESFKRAYATTIACSYLQYYSMFVINVNFHNTGFSL